MKEKICRGNVIWLKEYSVAYKKVERKKDKKVKENSLLEPAYLQKPEIWRLEAYQIPIGGENSALICWLEVHIAESHLTAGSNLMRCREKVINLAGRGGKRKKNNLCVDCGCCRKRPERRKEK